MRQVVASAGVRGGLYRGWTLTALCRMSNYAYFGPYEYFRIRRLLGHDGFPVFSHLHRQSVYLLEHASQNLTLSTSEPVENGICG